MQINHRRKEATHCKVSFFFGLLGCRLAEALLEKETLARPDIVEIMEARPYPYKATILEYLEELKLRDVEDKEAEVKKTEDAAKAQEED